MSEITMRPIGLKLVFGAAVTLLLVSSVKQQWNSSQQKFARQVSPPNTQASEHDELRDEGAVLETDDRVERIDANLDGNSIETILANENDGDGDEISSENQLSSLHQEEHREDILNQGEGQEPDYDRNSRATMGNDESVDNSQIAVPAYVSAQAILVSQADIAQQEISETEPDIPDYDTSDGQDQDWRSTKYADALYDDEEEDNGEKDKLHLGEGVITENDKVSEKTYQHSDNSFVGNSDSKQASLLSWFGLGNYFLDVDKHRELENDRISESRLDSNNYDTNLLNDKASKISGLDLGNRFLTDKEENETVGSSNMTFNEIYNEVSKIINDTNNFDSLRMETNKLQSNPTNKELPFGVNGIDVANYEDYDHEDLEDDQTQTKGTEYRNGIEYANENSQSDALKADPDPEIGFSEGRNSVSFAEDDTHVLRFDDQRRETDHMDASDFHNTGEIQRGQEQAQHLIYDGEQIPPPSNSLQLQSTSKSPTPQRILDLILANNLELSQSQQFLAKLRYYLHQNIHRIDQDVDPNSNKTGSTFSRQAQSVVLPQSNTNNVLLSKMTAMGEFDSSNTQETEIVNSLEFNNNDIYDGKTGNTGPFYDTIHTNNDVHETDDNRDYTKGQPGTYTPLPEPAVYDNPRPLSEREFALYRTQPYNTSLSLTKSVSESAVEVKFTDDHSKTNNTVLEQQQTNKQDTKREDESIPCPRQLHLARTTQPITALVSFSDSSTVWVRNMLEQLTGIQTDSIYNIMAQLKSGNAESVYHMGRKIVIETHMASEKNFDRAIVVIRNPFTVDANHRIFRPSTIEWQNSVLWNATYSTWLNSSLPLHVVTFEDLVQSPLTELMKLANFLSTPDVTISYKCAMKVALDPPSVINDVKEITGIYHDDRRRINQNIDYVIQVALKKHPDIVLRLNSYKVLSGT